MSIIQLHAVTKSYGAQKALDNVTLSFQENVTTAIVGTSGSGKSTLLQLINGLVQPTSGSIEVFDEKIDYRNLPALRLHIGYAVQGTGLFPHMTIHKNITILAKLAGWPPEKVSARVEQLMDLVGLPHNFDKRYPHELSGGQQQRVGLCRAMMLNPKIFLLDEAFGALDPITRAEVHEEFTHLQRAEPRTIVMVTHDLNEANKLAERIVIMSHGRIEQSGSYQELIDNPETEFVDSFLKSQQS